jgi:hypothetical protein
MEGYEVIVLVLGLIISISLVGLLIVLRGQAADDRELNRRIDEYARRWEDED